VTLNRISVFRIYFPGIKSEENKVKLISKTTVPETEDSEGATAIDLAIEWDIFDIRVKYPLMGWK
jgi:hypothetical protein